MVSINLDGSVDAPLVCDGPHSWHMNPAATDPGTNIGNLLPLGSCRLQQWFLYCNVKYGVCFLMLYVSSGIRYFNFI